MAKRDIGRFKETREVADSLKAKGESELFYAKRTVRNLSSLIRKSDSKAKAQKQEIETLKKSTRHKGKALTFVDMENSKYAEVMRELETVKQELHMLKLDMAAVSEEKLKAEKLIKASRLKVSSCSSSLEAVKKELEGVNEEQVLVELARIEALKENGEIEAEREKEANRFSSAIEKTKRQMKDIVDDIEQSKELEPKLAATMADVDVLQNELMLVKEMERRVRRNGSLKGSEESFQREADLDASLSLQSVTEELEAAKKELDSVKEEGFQYMTSMDIIRNELIHVRAETARLEKIEKNNDLTVRSLNSKLLRAKSKLEAVSTAEEKAKSIVSNLSFTLEQLKTEAEAAKKEKELIVQEAASTKAEIRKTELEIDLTEEKLQAAMQELEAVKSSEALALENLKSRIENTVGARTTALEHSSSITISKFEYEYLTGRAVGAEELADKKVAAAKAWIAAIKSSEKEILMKTDLAQREITEMGMGQEREAYGMQRSISTKKMVEKELQNLRTRPEKNGPVENLQLTLHRRSMRGNSNGNLTPSRLAKYRKSASPGGRNSFPIKKKRQVMPDLAKFFKSKANKNP